MRWCSAIAVVVLVALPSAARAGDETPAGRTTEHPGDLVFGLNPFLGVGITTMDYEPLAGTPFRFSLGATLEATFCPRAQGWAFGPYARVLTLYGFDDLTLAGGVFGSVRVVSSLSLGASFEGYARTAGDYEDNAGIGAGVFVSIGELFAGSLAPFARIRADGRMGLRRPDEYTLTISLEIHFLLGAAPLMLIALM